MKTKILKGTSVLTKSKKTKLKPTTIYGMPVYFSKELGEVIASVPMVSEWGCGRNKKLAMKALRATLKYIHKLFINTPDKKLGPCLLKHKTILIKKMKNVK